MSPAMVAAAALRGARRRRARGPLDGRAASSACAGPRPACCAATTSTPTASSRRASCAASPSTASASTRSRTTASRRRATTRSTTRASRARTILIVGRNFGCGSSREHAPQSLMRRGFRRLRRRLVRGDLRRQLHRARPALRRRSRARDLDALMDAVEARPGAGASTVDLAARTRHLRARARSPRGIPDGARRQLLEGSWNATAVLLDAGDAIERTARARCPT